MIRIDNAWTRVLLQPARCQAPRVTIWHRVIVISDVSCVLEKEKKRAGIFINKVVLLFSVDRDMSFILGAI